MNFSPSFAQSLPLDVGFCQLKQHLITVTGLAYYQEKDDELATLVARRMAVLNIGDCLAYLHLLCSGLAGAAELDTLAASLTIGETFFFRHEELFNALSSTVFPALIRRNQEHRRLRIWSAGCAIGAEAYSLSILLARDFGSQLAGWDVSILGTDINREFLTQAQRGEYTEWAFRTTGEQLRADYFTRVGGTSGPWRIRDEYRRGVSFQYHNLVQHHFPSLVSNLSSFDLILCRNVMIYFEPAVVTRLIHQFRESLVDEGWLVVGHAEPNVEMYRELSTVNLTGAVLYQRQSGNAAPDTAFPWAATPPAWLVPSLSTIQVPTFPTMPVPAPGPAAFSPTQQPRASQPRASQPRASQPRATPPRATPRLVPLATVRTLLDRGEWETARETCRRLEATERMNPLLYFYEALIFEQIGPHAETEPALKRSLYLDRDFVLGHYYLGLVQQRNRDPNAARSFRNVLSLLEKSSEAEILPDADGLTVGELQQLSQMQLELLSES